MATKKDIYHMWLQYTTKNEEQYFRQFISGFVTIWESQLQLHWSETAQCSAVRHDAGPHLSRLPEELLPAIVKFMYIAREDTDKGTLTSQGLEDMQLLIKCLLIISRNFDNIPFIASCDYVKQAVGIAATLVHTVLEEQPALRAGSADYVLTLCHFLESLYDPCSTWRLFLAGHGAPWDGVCVQPALLHVEVVPFIYDCFRTTLSQSVPDVSTELLHVLGAVVSGARNMILRLNTLTSEEGRKAVNSSTHSLKVGHNALRAICPATVNIIMGVVSTGRAPRQVRHTAVHCFVIMVRVLNLSSPDQRQIEVSTMVQQYQDTLLELTTGARHDGWVEDLCLVVSALKMVLAEESCKHHVQRVMVQNQMLEAVITVAEECVKYNYDTQKLASVCVDTMTAMMMDFPDAMERMANTGSYDRLFDALTAMGKPTRELLGSLLAMCTHGKGEGDTMGMLKDADPVLLLLRWLVDMSVDDQLWTVSAVLSLCTASLQSKQVSCERGVILSVCHALELHDRVVPKVANELIKLLEVLASHSIVPNELREVFMLLREDAQTKFPYKVQLLHAVSSVARRDDSVYCHNYFDIQKDTDMISVPGIRKWSGANYGFTFHCWLRLDTIPDAGNAPNYRRQLFLLTSNAGVGMEIFFRPDGCLVVCVSSKKDFLTACVPDVPVLDGMWHCVDVCHAAARRPFGQNQLVVYIDGVQRLAVSVKSPSMTDPFTKCMVGSAAAHPPMNPEQQVVGGPDRGLLPSLLTQVPAYLMLPLRSAAPVDPNVCSYPAGLQDTVCGTVVSLHGQVGMLALFQEAVGQQQAKALHEGGPNGRCLLSPDLPPDLNDLSSRLVFCYCPEACTSTCCLDLASGSKYSGHLVARLCRTVPIKTAITAIGGPPVLFPLLENASRCEDGPDLGFLSPAMERELRLIDGRDGSVDSDGWEVLPSSSYSDWKLEQNPVSGFLTLLKNMLTGSVANQELLLKGKGLAVVGFLLAKVKPDLIDVNVLMAVQLLVEMAKAADNVALLRAVHQHVVFNFHVWGRSQFHVMIGHVLYISTVITDDRKYFRKKYGIQFFLDVLRRFLRCCDQVSEDDLKTLRSSVLGLVKYYMQRETSYREVAAIMGFLAAVTDEALVQEVVDMLASHVDSRSCKDQTVFLLYEPHCVDILYSILVDQEMAMGVKESVLRLFAVLLSSKLVFERNKSRLRLQDVTLMGSASTGMYSGLVSLMGGMELSSGVVTLLLDQMLSTDNAAGYAGALTLLQSLSQASLDLKLVATRKVLTKTFIKGCAARLMAKQPAWQDSVTRLLIKRPLTTIEVDDDPLPDLMTFDDLPSEPPAQSPSSLTKLSSHVTDAAAVLENELIEFGGTVTSAVADNINYAADNITSAVASAYSVFRQKTVEMQESLEELGESAVSCLKTHRSLIPVYEQPEQEGGGMSPLDVLASLGLDHDIFSMGNRSQTSSSTEELSSPHCGEPMTSKDDISIASTHSMFNVSANGEEEVEDERIVAMQPWKELDPEMLVDHEDELCYLVLNILFAVMWKGVEGSGREAWKERGQVVTCINLLAHSNELYRTPASLNCQLLEMMVQALVVELRTNGQAVCGHTENAAQLLRWIYDTVVVNQSSSVADTMSIKLLDGILSLVDALMVFQEGPGEEWSDMVKLSLGILLSCAASRDLEVCAVATAKLHTLIQTRDMTDLEEGAYLLHLMHCNVQTALQDNNQEHYSFLIPVMKALLDKMQDILALPANVPDLPHTQAGPAFFEDYQLFCVGGQWKAFMDRKVRPHHERYHGAVSGAHVRLMEPFWGECVEASRQAVSRRNMEVMDSEARFQTQVVQEFRRRRAVDADQYRVLVGAEQAQQHLLERRWRHFKDFLSGPRGAWQARSPLERHWKLSPHENFSRMRPKLCPSHGFQDHAEASSLRDNAANVKRNLTGTPGWLHRITQILPLPAAARRDVNEDGGVDGGGDEDAGLAEDEPTEPGVGPAVGGGAAPREKVVLCERCELVTLMSRVGGKLRVTPSHVTFWEAAPGRGAHRMDFKFPLSRLREVHLRRYNLRRSALEFFLTDQTNYLVNFTPKTRHKVLSRILAVRPSCVYTHTRTAEELLRASGLTRKWVCREISNFDYLMQLNTLAGRTYNDLSQYPVFPWVLADYSSDSLDLRDPATFRDLSRPIGVVNPKNVAEVKAKYDCFEDPSGTVAKFHYGTHYSNSAGVLHYLVRVEPFTSLHIELQSGRFDVADRQFHSLPQTWRLLMDNPNDVKELTPEFFYFPEFLRNINRFDLGLLQGTRERVDDVQLPPWAEGADDFIYQHRKALESEHVSAHLHEWIDLIFGYKQKGPEAVDALNVFYYCSYEGAVDLDAIEDDKERQAVEGMINNFGQTPIQLLREPHPPRLTRGEVLTLLGRGGLGGADLTLYLDHVRPCSVQVSTPEDPIVFVSSPRPPPRSFLQAAPADSVVSVTSGGVVGTHSWHRGRPREGAFDGDHTMASPKSRKKLSGPFHPEVPVSHHLFAVSPDGKFLLSGGHWDSSLHVYNLAKGKTVACVKGHFDVVTCVALDQCGTYLMTGSRDTVCVLWDMSGLTCNSTTPAPQPVKRLYGHRQGVTCVAVMTELDMAVSASLDGTVNVHTIQEGQYIRTLQPVGIPGLCARVTHIAVSAQGHVAFAATHKDRYSVHVYSVNGTPMGHKLVSSPVHGLVVAGDLLVVGDGEGEVTASTLYRLQPVYHIPLHVAINSVVVTTGNTHLLVPLTDGSVVVLGVVA